MIKFYIYIKNNIIYIIPLVHLSFVMVEKRN